MAEQYTRDTKIAFSTVPESTFNTADTTAGNYTGVFLDPVPTPMPQPEQTPILGNTEFPADFCNGYFAPIQVQANPVFTFTGMAGRFGLQAHGGTVTATQQAATAAYKHSCSLATAAQMVGRSMAAVNGNYSFLFAGNVVNTFAISQTGGALPVVEVGLLGTSKYTNACPFTVPAATGSCPAVPTTAILVTDSDATGRDLYSNKVYSWRMELNNGADATSDIVRLGSDSTQGPTGGTAKYVNSIVRSQNRTLSFTMRVPFEELTSGSSGYWKKMLTRESITSVSLRLRGDLIASTYYYEILWTIADGRWTATPISDNNGIQAYDLAFTPVNNATPVTFAVTNITTSDYK